MATKYGIPLDKKARTANAVFEAIVRLAGCPLGTLPQFELSEYEVETVSI
jgi:hypothetical protein